MEMVFNYLWDPFGRWNFKYFDKYLVILIYCIRQKLKEEDTKNKEV